jgi:hypothetical protein
LAAVGSTKKIAVFLGLVVTVLIGIFLWPNSAVPKITEEQVERIQVGMALHEVEAILGCPPGNYTYRDDFLPLNMRFYSTEQQELQAPFMEWAADKPEPRYVDDNGPNRQEAIGIRVWFDDDDKVIDKCRMGYSYTHCTPSLWDRVRRLLAKWQSNK